MVHSIVNKWLKQHEHGLLGIPPSLNYDHSIIGAFPHDHLYDLSTVISCCFSIFLIFKRAILSYISASMSLSQYCFARMTCMRIRQKEIRVVCLYSISNSLTAQ